MLRLSIYSYFAVSLLCISGAFPLFAADLESASYIVRDPIMGVGGVYADSASFSVFTEPSPTFILSEDATPPSGGGGGGGQGGSSGGSRASQVSFYGYAHPHGTVTLLRDGVIIREISVGGDGSFSISVSDITPGSYMFTMYGVDEGGVRSGLISLPISIIEAVSLSATRIFLPPTLSFDPNAPTGTSRIFGNTVPNANVAIAVTDGPTTLALQTALSDADGRYSINLASPELFSEGFAVRALASVGGIKSPFGIALHLAKAEREQRGDYNGDARVNLVDFSILAYWQGREGVPAKFDLNGDGVISLADFSILTYHWTG